MRIGHAGNGTTSHLALLRLEQRLGVTFTALAYKSSAAATADLPETPSLSELGLKGFETVVGAGLLAPAKTLPATVKMLAYVLQKVLDDAAVQAKLKRLGSERRALRPRRV